MEQVKHTPGPWRVDADGIEVGDPNGFKPFGACGCCDSPWMRADDVETAKADARLIAAAPTMYAYIEQRVAEGDEVARAILGEIHANS